MPVYSTYRVAWTPNPFTNYLKRGIARNLDAAIKEYRKFVVDDIKHQGHPGYHSKPGHAPFKQSGDLIRSYRTMTNRSALEAYLYTDLEYALFLEFGTRKMAPRPHLRYNLFSRMAQLAAILTRPI